MLAGRSETHIHLRKLSYFNTWYQPFKLVVNLLISTAHTFLLQSCGRGWKGASGNLQSWRSHRNSSRGGGVGGMFLALGHTLRYTECPMVHGPGSPFTCPRQEHFPLSGVLGFFLTLNLVKLSKEFSHVISFHLRDRQTTYFTSGVAECGKAKLAPLSHLLR